MGVGPVVASASVAWLEEVRAVAAAMQEAVRAGDAAGYLKHVVPADGPLGDACFRQEQAGLAADFAKRPVPDFSWAIDTEPMTLADLSVPKDQQWPTDAPALTATRMEVRASMAWTPEAERVNDPSPNLKLTRAPSRTLKLPVAFVRERAGSPWLYAGERWATHRRDPDAGIGFAGVRVRFAGGDKVQAKEASLIAAQMPRIRREVDEHFGVRVDRVQEIKLYRSAKHLQASVWLNYTDALGGWNEPGESMKVLLSASTARRVFGIVAHEYGHVASFELGPKATDAPWWSLEGSAELASEAFRTDAKDKRDALVLAWYARGELAPWEAIAPFPLAKEHEKYGRHVYAQGEHVLAFIVDRFGADAYRALLRELASGKPLHEACVAAIKRPWAEVDGLWRAELSQQAKAQAALEKQPPAPAPDDEDEEGKRTSPKKDNQP